MAFEFTKSWGTNVAEYLSHLVVTHQLIIFERTKDIQLEF